MKILRLLFQTALIIFNYTGEVIKRKTKLQFVSYILLYYNCTKKVMKYNSFFFKYYLNKIKTARENKIKLYNSNVFTVGNTSKKVINLLFLCDTSFHVAELPFSFATTSKIKTYILNYKLLNNHFFHKKKSYKSFIHTSAYTSNTIEKSAGKFRSWI